MTARKNPAFDSRYTKSLGIERRATFNCRWDDPQAKDRKRGVCIDWSGYSHDELTIIRPATKEDEQNYEVRYGSESAQGKLFLVECSCGKKLVLLSAIARKYKSCGCAGSRGLLVRADRPEEQLIESAIYRAYDTTRRSAEYRDLSFGLTLESFGELIMQPCTYCGELPRGCRKMRVKNRHAKNRFFCNGVDRVDSDRGYENDNCVPCCRRCNLAKNDMTLGEFREWLGRTASTMRVSRGVMNASDWELDAASTG